jgi:beta-glucosidase
MDRRTAIKILSLGFSATLINDRLSGLERFLEEELKVADFGSDFLWGVATSAYQTEGAYNVDGRGLSVWDRFSHTEGNIKNNQTGDIACDFYHKYPGDINLVKDLNFRAFRFSLSWPRILPSGKTRENQNGIDFYQRVIDECLKQGIEPWITLYHWDLPQDLEDRGGWKNREVVDRFSEYALLCAKTFGDRVKNWMVLNEPFAFTTLGYLLGMHAPGKYGLKNFIPVVHHAALCQGIGGRILRDNIKNARVGTTYSISVVDPFEKKEENLLAVKRYDALLNRLFIEPACGLRYPVSDLPFLSGIEKYIRPEDPSLLKFDFDFIGVQNYTRVVVKNCPLMPLLHGIPVSPKRKKLGPVTEMGWEIYPEGIYRALKFYEKYPVHDIYITENGAAYKDVLNQGKIHDTDRINFLKLYLKEVLKAKKEGINVKGYFVWSLLDNFEWAEGYTKRFGIVYVDFPSQIRYIKDSGYWFQEFLHNSR